MFRRIYLARASDSVVLLVWVANPLLSLSLGRGEVSVISSIHDCSAGINTWPIHPKMLDNFFGARRFARRVVVHYTLIERIGSGKSLRI